MKLILKIFRKIFILKQFVFLLLVLKSIKKLTSKTEALKNFKAFPLRNPKCLSGGKNLKSSNNLSFCPSLGILGNYLKL